MSIHFHAYCGTTAPARNRNLFLSLHLPIQRGSEEILPVKLICDILDVFPTILIVGSLLALVPPLCIEPLKCSFSPFFPANQCFPSRCPAIAFQRRQSQRFADLESKGFSLSGYLGPPVMDPFSVFFKGVFPQRDQ